MKKLIFTLVVAFMAIISADAQVYVGGSFNLTHDKNADVTNFTIAPEVGYNLNKTWAIAAEIGYTHFKNGELKANAFNFAPYARFSFFEKGIVRLFVDGGVGVSTYKKKATTVSTALKSVLSRVSLLRYARTLHSLLNTDLQVTAMITNMATVHPVSA